MNRIIRTITACVLMLVMTAISPMTDLSQSLSGGTNGNPDPHGGSVAKAATIAKAAETDTAGADIDTSTDRRLYISDVKVGMGETEAEARAELDAEGYMIMTNDDGTPADINQGAGADTNLKDGPTSRIVYLGYKVTTDPDQAVTDLAVMNMDGGYSVEDYETMMQNRLDSEIKPFIDRFITTMNEYRENLKKPADTMNYKRADLSRRMLNKLLDDDTDGQPVGDLFIEKTKYEIGDAAYNKLSESEKKKHADIVTMLMQGNGKAVLLAETYLTRAADTAENTWLDRLGRITLEDLVDEVKTQDLSLKTKSEVYEKLDKKYNDAAKWLLKKWGASSERLANYEEIGEEALESSEETQEKMDDAVDKLKSPDSSEPEEVAEEMAELEVLNMENLTDMANMQTATVASYLESIQYDGDTMLAFFQQGEDSFQGDGIRKLYPVVASLSDGQLAGFDFLSVLDLLSLGIRSEEGLDKSELKDLKEVSFYEKVDREIYKPGGVALTNEAMRAKAASAEQPDDEGDGVVSWVHILMYVGTGLAIAGTVASAVKLASIRSSNTAFLAPFKQNVTKAQDNISLFNAKVRKMSDAQWEKWTEQEKDLFFTKSREFRGKLIDQADATQREYTEALGQTKSTFGATALLVTFAVVTIALTVMSVWTTISSYKEYYNTKFKAIPRYMVDETSITAYNSKGERVVINNQTAYYKSVLCNRKPDNSDREKEVYDVLADRSDLNGDVGKQWLALYSVKYEQGYPILADSFKVVRGKYKENMNVPSGYSTGIHEFGSMTALNLNKKIYLFAEEPPTIHVFYKNAEMSVSDLKSTKTGKSGASDANHSDGSASGTTGSIFSDGSGSDSGTLVKGLAIGGGIGIVLGALLMALIMYIARRKKVAVAETDEKEVSL